MKKHINFYDFAESFYRMKRYNFSYEGLEALFNYFEDLEDSLEIEIEFDVIGICCNYTEYENLDEFKKDFTDEKFIDLESIQNETNVICIDSEEEINQNKGRFIIENF